MIADIRGDNNMWLLLLSLIFPAHGAECRHSGKRLSCVEFVDNYDGDTITFTIPRLYPLFGDRVRVRLQGVDTPEVKATKSCERDLAVKVKAKVRGLLNKAKRIDLVNPKRDKYFRILADVQADGVSIGEYLLKMGWGITYNGEAKSNHNWCKSQSKIKSEDDLTEIAETTQNLDFNLPHDPYQGRFQFSGELEPSQFVHSVRIYLNGEVAREKMIALINRGYICEKRLGQIVLCRRLSDLTEIPDAIAAQMRESVQQMNIQFASYQGSGTLITDGTSYREWEVPGAVEINGEKYQSYIFSKQQSGLVKVMMGYETPLKRYSFVANGDTLKYFVRVLVEEKWEWNEYTALAVFQSVSPE